MKISGSGELYKASPRDYVSGYMGVLLVAVFHFIVSRRDPVDQRDEGLKSWGSAACGFVGTIDYRRTDHQFHGWPPAVTCTECQESESFQLALLRYTDL